MLHTAYHWAITDKSAGQESLILYKGLTAIMTQSNGLSHHRRSPSGSNSSKRPARPAIHRKGTSFANISISKLGSGQARTASTDDDRTPEMAASFLNYWYVLRFIYTLLIIHRHLLPAPILGRWGLIVIIIQTLACRTPTYQLCLC